MSLKSTGFFSHPDCQKHEMGHGHPECPERLTAIEDHLLYIGMSDVLSQYSAPLAALSSIELAHSHQHIASLRGLGDLLMDEIDAGGPTHAQIDPDTSINVHTWQAALRAATHWCGSAAARPMRSGRPRRCCRATRCPASRTSRCRRSRTAARCR